MIRCVSIALRVFAGVIVLVTPLVLSSSPARAQMTMEMRSLNERVDRLTRELNAIQSQLNAGGGAAAPTSGDATSGSVAAQLDARIGQLESQMRELNGKIEESNFAQSQLTQRVDRLATDLEFRLSTLEKAQAAAAENAAAAAAAAQTPPPAQKAAAAGGDGTAPGAPPRNLGTIPDKDGGAKDKDSKDKAKAKDADTQISAVTLPPGSAKDQYDYAFDLLIRAQYAQAEQALKAFIAAHPSDALTPNAQYWLGESFFARQEYGDAAAQFLVGYQKYPLSPKAADNLLKLGLSLQNLGKKQEACAAYGRFGKEYPNASLTLKRRVTEERARLACA